MKKVGVLSLQGDFAAHGSALVRAVESSLDGQKRATGKTVAAVTDLVAALSQGVRGSRLMAAE